MFWLVGGQQTRRGPNSIFEVEVSLADMYVFIPLHLPWHSHPRLGTLVQA